MLLYYSKKHGRLIPTRFSRANFENKTKEKMEDKVQYMPPEAQAMAEKTKGAETPELKAYEEKATATMPTAPAEPEAEPTAPAEPEAEPTAPAEPEEELIPTEF
jgi:hypothetical protein